MYKNYKIIKEQNLKDINAYGTLLSHEQSGARILLLQNDDENKSFCVGFRTPPYDDTGLPHILEHSVLCGSRKYPVKEPFVELMKSSLNTFLNAMTFPDKTIYPIASCNDQDFRNLMDVYMDAVLYPNIHSIESIFKQEGWHYELESPESDLIYNGVVYNEMKGAFSSPDGILGRESMNVMFPDTAYGVESGGNPDYIPNLTYDKFKEFHKKYYHPSNSYIVIYGNCNMEETLKFLDDEYLSKFEKIDIDSTIQIQKPFDKLHEKTVLYPVSAEQGVENKTLMSYNVTLPAHTNNTDLIGLEILTRVLLESAGAPLKKALLDAKIGDVVTGDFESGIIQPCFTIISKNTNECEKERFINIIEQSLKQYAKEGLNKKALTAAINSYEFIVREADYGRASKGLIYTINCLGTWLYDDNDPFSVFEFSKAFEYLKENINNNYFENLIEKYLLNNTHKGIVVCKPSLDIQSKKEKELKEKLNEYKKSLSEDQIKEIIESTKALKQYQASPDVKEDLDKMPTLSKEDLTYDVIPIKNKEFKINDVKVLHHNYSSNGIAYYSILFNAKNIPAQLMPYLGVLKNLFGKLNTSNHCYETLEQDILINSGGISPSVLSNQREENCDLYFVIDVKALYNNIEFTLDTIDEIINTTNYDMKDRIKECLSMTVSYLQQSLVNGGHTKAATRSLSYNEENHYYNDLVDGIQFFDILTDLLQNYEEKYNEVVNNLSELSKYLFSRNNLLISYTGDDEGFELFEKQIGKFINKVENNIHTRNVFEFIPNQKNEGFKAPFDVNYVALTGNFKKAGLTFDGSLYVFENLLRTDYLWKNVRVLGGAYGCMCAFSPNGQMYFTSYRDPNIEKTLDTYKNIIKYVEEFEANDEEITKFIIGAIGSYDSPLSTFRKGRRSLIAYFNNKNDEYYKNVKVQIINTTLDDIKKGIPYIKCILEQNNVCVIGNDKKIDNTNNIFKETKPLLK